MHPSEVHDCMHRKKKNNTEKAYVIHVQMYMTCLFSFYSTVKMKMFHIYVFLETVETSSIFCLREKVRPIARDVNSNVLN